MKINKIIIGLVFAGISFDMIHSGPPKVAVVSNVAGGTSANSASSGWFTLPNLLLTASVATSLTALYKMRQVDHRMAVMKGQMSLLSTEQKTTNQCLPAFVKREDIAALVKAEDVDSILRQYVRREDIAALVKAEDVDRIFQQCVKRDQLAETAFKQSE